MLEDPDGRVKIKVIGRMLKKIYIMTLLEALLMNKRYNCSQTTALKIKTHTHNLAKFKTFLKSETCMSLIVYNCAVRTARMK